MSRSVARLALADGTVFTGRAFGGRGESAGEVVFNTAHSGYEEVVTDPSYRGQIVVMTAPQIGNVGWNVQDLESVRAHAAGFVVRELSSVPSSWRSQGSLDEALQVAGVPGISGVDTRLLTRIIRDRGAQAAVISHAALTDRSNEELVQQARAWGGMEGRDLVREVTCSAGYEWREPSVQMPGVEVAAASRVGRVVVFDYGVKQNILRQLVDVGFEVQVVPGTATAAEALSLGPDAVLLSNGPGDPAAVPYGVEAVKAILETGKPVFGICLGHQILGLALGGRTYKLKFGHHGINHPVQDVVSGSVDITSQNHGFAVDVASVPGARLTHTNLNDGTVEGLALPGRPVFSVQYHPEASPGPHEAGALFRRFVRLLDEDPERVFGFGGSR